MDWKTSFDRETLMDGFLLYRQGTVTDLTRQGETISGLVDGRYPVQARIEQDTITGISCPCPNSRHGHLCKHDAALLFAIEADPTLLNQETENQTAVQKAPDYPDERASVSNSFANDTAHPAVAPDESGHEAQSSFRRPKVSSIPGHHAYGFPYHREAGSEEKPYSDHPVNPPHPEYSSHPSYSPYTTPSENQATDHSGSDYDSGPDDDADDVLHKLQRSFLSHPSQEHPDQPLNPNQAAHLNDQNEHKATLNDHTSHADADIPDDSTYNDLLKALFSDYGLGSSTSENTKTKPARENIHRHIDWDDEPTTDAFTGRPFEENRQEQNNRTSSDLLKNQEKPALLKEKKSDSARWDQTARQKTVQKPELKPEVKPEPTSKVKPVPEQISKQPKETVPEKQSASAKVNESFMSFSSFINKMDETRLKKAIESYSRSHPDLKDYLVASMAREYPIEVTDYLEQEARFRLQKLLSQDQPFLSHYDLKEARSFASWLDEQIGLLDQADAQASAADLLESALKTLGSLSSLNSQPAVEWLGAHLFESLEQLLNSADPAVIVDVFSWIELSLDQKSLPDFEVQMVRLLERPCFDLESLAKPKYDTLVRIMDRMETEGRSPRVKKHLIHSILNLQEERPDLVQASPDFTKKYGSLPSVLMEKASMDLENGEYEKALKELELTRRKTMTPAQEEALLRSLIVVHQKLNHPEIAQRELNELIFILQSATADDVALLKELESEAEWKADLERLKGLDDPDLLIPVLAQENDGEALMQIMEEKGLLHHLSAFEEQLMAIDADRTAALWLKFARELGEQAQERRDYRRCAMALQKAAASPAHKEEADKLAQEIRTAQHRRRAFLEELDKAGF